MNINEEVGRIWTDATPTPSLWRDLNLAICCQCRHFWISIYLYVWGVARNNH